MYYSTHYSSPLGPLTLASDGEHLAGLWLEGQKYFGDTVSGDMEERDGLPVFAAARDWLDRYFAGGRPPVAELPLAPVGGEFRQAYGRFSATFPTERLPLTERLPGRWPRAGIEGACLLRQ